MSQQDKNSFFYQHAISRRDSLKLFTALASTSLLPVLTGCEPAPVSVTTATSSERSAAGSPAPWPNLTPSPLQASGYGKDPHLLIKPASPWPLTLTANQLATLALLADLILPRQGNWPAASELAVPTVLDEWVSAPYPVQQQDRVILLNLLQWLDDEASQRGLSRFTASQPTSTAPRFAVQRSILDDIAVIPTAPAFSTAGRAFDRVRQLVVAAYYCHETGGQLLGYQGNIAIAGDYPGPSDAAYQHLNSQLAKLGLTAVTIS